MLQSTQVTTDWSDEFDGPAGTAPDSTKWALDVGHNDGWGNHELQTYTDRAENAHLDGLGHLVIHVEATRTGFASARLKTRGRATFQYGQIEVRLKAPSGRGLWPAFWLLGDTFDGTNWPTVGEIDVVELVGDQPSTSRGSLHGPGYSGAAGISTEYVLQRDQRFTNHFHTFAVRWEPQTLTFYVDGNRYARLTPAALPAGTQWVFDSPFYLLLNVAVGGYAGAPDSTTSLPQDMLVDYVRYAPWRGTPQSDSRR